MFKPTPNAIGNLTQMCTSVDTVLYVTSALFNYLQANVDFDNQYVTYLELGSIPNAEHIRVTALSTSNPLGIVVDRGLNGTTARTFTAATPIRYVLTAEAVRDIVVQEGVSVNITASYPIYAEQNADTKVWEISMEPLGLNGSSSIDVSGEWPTYDFSVNPNSQGCGMAVVWDCSLTIVRITPSIEITFTTSDSPLLPIIR